MNISNDNKVMIFAREYQGYTFYSVGLSKKDKDNNFVNGYMSCQFRKDVKVENMTQIYIKKAWLSFYLDKDKKTVPYIFINEFVTVDEAIDNAKKDVEENKKVTNDPYKEFAEEYVINESDLPF